MPVTAVEPNAPVNGSDLFPTGNGDDIDPGGSLLGADPGAPPAEQAAEPFAEDEETGDDLRELTPAAPSAPGIRPYRATSGRYRSQAIGYQLELRVDVDGRHPLRMMSGDYFAARGATRTYFGSWTVDAVTVTTTRNAVVIVGTARTTWSTTFTVVTVTIPRTRLFQQAMPARVSWSTPSGAVGSSYVCRWESGTFRMVELEQDCEEGVVPFTSYHTGALPSGGTARTLSVPTAYAEAGVQMIDTGGGDVVRTSADHVWDNASLHHAMEVHFSRWQDAPQFKVWLLHAARHEFTTATQTLLGIMFDQMNSQRQGCATFYERIAANTPENQRTQLHTNVHELGHCFNLFHSFQKSRMNPPLSDRPGSLSWMNYPQRYDPGNGDAAGPGAFWAAFPFQFDDLELAHLRHGFRDAVIMGGNPFGTGAASELPTASVTDTSGLLLRVELATHERPVLGMPVVLQITLVAERTQLVNSRAQLHPQYGFVQVLVSRPRGDVVIHDPPVKQCATPELVRSGGGAESPISAYIGYDASVGQIFEDPGTYRIAAVYSAPDGSVITSNVTTVRVSAPRTDEEDQVAGLMLGDQTGMALTLIGSDSEYLSEGMDALRTVNGQFSEHPSAVYARFVLGMNAARPFTRLEPDGTVDEEPRNLDDADLLLRGAIDVSLGAGGLDDLTVYQAAAYLADCHADVGDDVGARELRAEAKQLAQAKGAPETVIQSLDE